MPSSSLCVVCIKLSVAWVYGLIDGHMVMKRFCAWGTTYEYSLFCRKKKTAIFFLFVSFFENMCCDKRSSMNKYPAGKWIREKCYRRNVYHPVMHSSFIIQKLLRNGLFNFLRSAKLNARLYTIFLYEITSNWCPRFRIDSFNHSNQFSKRLKNNALDGRPTTSEDT